MCCYLKKTKINSRQKRLTLWQISTLVQKDAPFSSGLFLRLREHIFWLRGKDVRCH